MGILYSSALMKAQERDYKQGRILSRYINTSTRNTLKKQRAITSSWHTKAHSNDKMNIFFSQIGPRGGKCRKNSKMFRY